MNDKPNRTADQEEQRDKVHQRKRNKRRGGQGKERTFDGTTDEIRIAEWSVKAGAKNNKHRKKDKEDQTYRPSKSDKTVKTKAEREKETKRRRRGGEMDKQTSGGRRDLTSRLKDRRCKSSPLYMSAVKHRDGWEPVDVKHIRKTNSKHHWMPNEIF